MPTLKQNSRPIQLRLRLILERPPAGVDFGLQEGKGNNYRTVQKQRSDGGDLIFDCAVEVGQRSDGQPNFLGPVTQGPPAARFIYIDIGKAAGQTNSAWQRRIKAPLGGIHWEMIQEAAADARKVIEARFPGTGRDGGPSCATLHPLGGWKTTRLAP